MSMHVYAKISIITPCYNSVEFIEQTILSVINQDYLNLEYIIVDGGSTDGTLDIIKKYDAHVTHWISEPDSGMYDALNKGFQLSTGQIMTWINSDDMLLPSALKNMRELFTDLPQVNWIHGLNSFINLNGNVISQNEPKKFSFVKYLNRDYQFIQQESTFWRRALWEKSGSRINTSLKYAGDFELWFRFFQYDTVFTTSMAIGAWRKREGQLSDLHMNAYLKECDDIISNYTKTWQQKKNLILLKILYWLMKSLEKKQLPFHFIKKRIKHIENEPFTQIKFSKELNHYILN